MSPQEGYLPAAVTWAADNGCFGKGYLGDNRWLAWLEKHSPAAGTALFATAPDILGDTAATLVRSAPWFAPIRALGYRAALVAQDGLRPRDIPWDQVDAVFLGGLTEWKLRPEAARVAHAAEARGKELHMGRSTPESGGVTRKVSRATRRTGRSWRSRRTLISARCVRGWPNRHRCCQLRAEIV